MNHCYNCGDVLPERTSTGRRRHYCNDACRMAYKRKTEQTKNEQGSTKGITHKAKTVTPNVTPSNNSLMVGLNQTQREGTPSGLVETEIAEGQLPKPAGMTQGISIGLPDVPDPGTLTKEEIATYLRNLTASEAQAILDSWAAGHGTAHQQDLALLGRAYG